MAWGTAAITDIYLDPLNGSDAGRGTVDSPVKTITTAANLLSVNGGGTIWAKAPQANPLTGAWTYTTPKDITLRPWDLDTFYWDGSAGTHCIRAQSPNTLTIRNGNFSNAQRTVIVGSSGAAGTGKLVAIDSYAGGSASGWASELTWVSLDATRCTGHGGTNDGWNLNGAGTATLTDCIGDDCGDEGASPHETCTLNIIGGHYNRNGQSGMAAVGSTVCNISGGAVFSDNGGSGIAYLDTSTGTLGEYVSTGNVSADILP